MDCYRFKCGSYIDSCGVYLSSATDSYGSMATMDLIGCATELLWCAMGFADEGTLTLWNVLEIICSLADDSLWFPNVLSVSFLVTEVDIHLLYE